MNAPAIFFFFASLNLSDLSRSWHTLDGTSQEHIVLFSALGLALMPPLAWALFFRKRRRRPHAYLHVSSPSRTQVSSCSDEQTRADGRKRRRREHHPRNPTLQTTGGLPASRGGQRSNGLS